MDKSISELYRKYQSDRNYKTGISLALLLSATEDPLLYDVLADVFRRNPKNKTGLAIASLLLQHYTVDELESLAANNSQESEAAYYALPYVYHFLYGLKIKDIQIESNDYTDFQYEFYFKLAKKYYANVYYGRYPKASYSIPSTYLHNFISDFSDARKALVDYYDLEEIIPEMQEIWDPAAQQSISYPTPEQVLRLQPEAAFDFEKGKYKETYGQEVGWRQPEGLVRFYIIEDYNVDEKDPEGEAEDEFRGDVKTSYYLNSYMVERVYGGPQEGGWWYDVGEPLASAYIGEWSYDEMNEFQTLRREGEALEDLIVNYNFVSLLNLSYSLYESLQTALTQPMYGSGLRIDPQDHPAVLYPQVPQYYE